MALGHDGLLHEVLGLLANLFPGCPEAQRAFCSGAAPSLLQRCLDLIFKPSLDLPTLEVCCCLAAVLLLLLLPRHYRSNFEYGCIIDFVPQNTVNTIVVTCRYTMQNVVTNHESPCRPDYSQNIFQVTMVHKGDILLLLCYHVAARHA